MEPVAIASIVKRAFDIAIGIFGCLLFIILYPLLALWIRWDSRGAVLYSQIRVGRDRRRASPDGSQYHPLRLEDCGGKPFRIYKFRSMRLDAEATGPKLCGGKSDDRITHSGKWLRALHLDELPQFWNILKGDMSFIGPRPERPCFSVKFNADIPLYRERTRYLRPGLTGLSQIILGYADDEAAMHKKAQGDFAYSTALTTWVGALRMEFFVLWNTLIYLIQRGPLPEKAPLIASAAPLNMNQEAKSTSKFLVKTGGLSPHWIPGSKTVFTSSTPLSLPKPLNNEAVSSFAKHALSAHRAGSPLHVRFTHPSAKRQLRTLGLDRLVRGIQTPQHTPHFLTFDLECWFHAHNLAIPESQWDSLDPRLDKPMDALLNLLKARQAKATFFVLGWVADRLPHLIRRLISEGHEVATHGYWHRKITDMTPDAFERDLGRSLESLAKAGATQVIGHRASNFSITKDSLWAFEVLARQGLVYDSSVYPIRRKRYGISQWPSDASRNVILENGDKITEVPMGTWTLGNQRIPIGGGGYFRLYPRSLTAAYLKAMQSKQKPAMVYLHPWEFDSQHPTQTAKGLKRIMHTVNLDNTLDRLGHFLDLGVFTSVKNNLASRAVLRDLAQSPIELMSPRIKHFSQEIPKFHPAWEGLLEPLPA